MKILNKTIIFPHIILLTEGRLFALIVIALQGICFHFLPDAARKIDIYIQSYAM